MITEAGILETDWVSSMTIVNDKLHMLQTRDVLQPFLSC